PVVPPVFKAGLSLLVGDGRFDSFPSPPNRRLLLSTDAGNYSQLLNWQISERWSLGKRCPEDVPTSGGENTYVPPVSSTRNRSRGRVGPHPGPHPRTPGRGSSGLAPSWTTGAYAGTQEERLPTSRQSGPCPAVEIVIVHTTLYFAPLDLFPLSPRSRPPAPPPRCSP